MKFLITKEYRLFYQEHGYIEFENIVSPIMCERFKLTFPQKEFPKKIFSSPRDLWRKEEIFHKLTFQRNFSELVHALTGISPIRLCLDQILCIDPTIEPPPTQPLTDFLSFKGLISALLLKVSEVPAIPLAPNEEQNELDGMSQPSTSGSLPGITDEKYAQENPPFPRAVGSGVFFSPEFPLDFALAKDLSPGIFFLIVYGEKHCQYVLNHKDSNSYAFKQMGYIYGSALKNKNHPLLYP